jgi:MoxR-like ATPase
METITLSQAKALIQALARKQSVLLLAPPGVGKSDTVRQAAAEAGLECRSLLGTQIAPEDVSGIPRIIGERSVFCPPRVLLPEDGRPFCLFLDELPACAPEIQKAFYSLLLERRLGEHPLPPGTWVVAAGNRAEDHALVRALSAALVNRLTILHVRVDGNEWLSWAEQNGVRAEVRDFIAQSPRRLLRPVPPSPAPFSTPRAWAALARALDLAERDGLLTNHTRQVLAFGRLSADDAAVFCEWAERGGGELPQDPSLAEKLALSLAELELSVRATNCLESEGITTVRALVVRTEEELLEVRNFGQFTLREVKAKLGALGLSLGMKLSDELPGYPPASDRTVTLSQAKALIRCLSAEQSLLLLSPPGVGKSEAVAQAAAEAGLECRSLLGTQIAPEDVSGIPRIIGERSVFCPPRVLLPEDGRPFCLFLDELPACAPEIQKAFYSLLLERRLGEHPLPPGTWVVAAGNRAEDRALVRAMSAALVNRVTILPIRVDAKEWLAWARAHRIRTEILALINLMPEVLMRPVPAEPVPFSTPRGWASLSRALDLAEQAGRLDHSVRRALAFGRVTAEDAAVFCAMAEEAIQELRPPTDYVEDPTLLPTEDTPRSFILWRLRNLVRRNELRAPPEQVNRFLLSLPPEHRMGLLVNLVREWGELGAGEALRKSLEEVVQP